jgi:hypothetical protein
MRYIYILKDPISKEVKYIGETSKPDQRYRQHCWGLTGDCDEKKLWLVGLKAMELRPLFEIIDFAEDKRAALIKENSAIVNYIKSGVLLFNVKNKTTLKQYNQFGQLIGEFSDGKRAFEITGIRARIDRCTTHGFQWTYGAFNPALFEQKESAKKVLCKPVLQLKETGEVVAEYEGVRIAYAKTGIDHRSISAVAGGSPKRKTAGGFVWKYKD